jgi:hypothetical protein
MAAVPQPERSTAAAIHLLHAVKSASEESRGYLGWSEIGHPCERYLWLKFRWVDREVFEGRIARLFDTGHREELRVLDELRALRCKVWDRDEDGEQFGVSSVGGHFRGHLDAVVEGLPEAPKTPHLVDVKTINTKNFKEITKKSMKNVFPKYWAQAHGYMGHKNLDRAMFIFVCKDDDQIHTERIQFDKAVFDQYEARAARIVTATEPPPRIADNAEDNECRYCVFKDECHGELAPMVNCRTCTHSTPVLTGDGEWQCAKGDGEPLPFRIQRVGCTVHRFIPILLENLGKPVDVDGDRVVYRMDDGSEFTNGEPPDGFTSAEIRAAGGKTFLRDAQVRELRKEFPKARLVERTAFDDMDSDIPF